jgi:hypothetical protein
MSPNLEEQLLKKYPSILQQYNLPKEASNMYWGFECNDGWYDIIDTLLTALSELYSTGIFFDGKSVSLEPPKVIANQVKEKFGTLRFYYSLEFPQQYHDFLTQYLNTDQERIIESWANGYRDYVDGIIHYAEVLSSRTCEVSGEKGVYHRSESGWVKVLNPEVAQTHPHYKDRNFKPINQNEIGN